MDATITLLPQSVARRRRVKPAEATPYADRFVREREVLLRTGISRSTRKRMEKAGSFPQRRKISPGCVGWLDSELCAWQAARAQ
jgi:prophage regulatory protein